MRFYDLINCTGDGRSCLCVAPAWSCLKPDDIVRVNDFEMKIVKILVAGINQEAYDFMRHSGVEIKRITSKVKVSYEAMDYSEESDYDDDCGVNGAEVSE